MSVMACDRVGCENIMCDRYSYIYGHICNNCFEELLLSDLDIPTFMDIKKRELPLFDKRKEYEKIFVSTDIEP